MATNIALREALEIYYDMDKEIQLIDVGEEDRPNLISRALEGGANINQVIEGGLKTNFDIVVAYKELFLQLDDNKLTPNNYLKMTMGAFFEIWVPSDAMVEKFIIFVKEAISLGADPNIKVKHYDGVSTALDLVSNSHEVRDSLAGFLKENGAKCSDESDRTKYFFQYEGLDRFYFEKLHNFSNELFSALHAQKGDIQKIPYQLNQIWLTHPDSPREIRLKDIKNTIENHKFLSNSAQEFKHIIWTNDKKLIPNSTYEFESHGIEVKNFDILKDQIRLYEQITDLVEQKKWGIASDALRYVLLEEKGGNYADLDFKFIRKLDDDIFTFDFVASGFINSCFGAKPHHPILESAVERVETNLLTPPPYMSSIGESGVFLETIYTTLLPFVLSILNRSNTDSNKDIIAGQIGAFEPDPVLLLAENECCTNPFRHVQNIASHLPICGNVDVWGRDGVTQSNGITWIE